MARRHSASSSASAWRAWCRACATRIGAATVAEINLPIVDIMEELVRFTILLRSYTATLTDCYSERKAAGRTIGAATELSVIAIASAKV